MADIFISYSRQDSEQANLLTELLTSAGLSVWIDRSGIEAATSWSEEIVDALDSCKAFIVMLSPASVASHNVVKEVSLASEKRKKILPLDLEPVELPKNMQYALAGIQRAPMTNIDAVIRALGKLGLEATQAPSIQLVKETDARKSLMILPFEDMSPTGDNGWFADGLASELISALSNVKALRVADPQATKEFKSYKGQLPIYAKEMSIRYFVQGDVRKFGDNIKITTRLLDVETGDFLWQDVHKGTMNDIFEIQETVALNVVEGLKVHLASDEKKKLAERGTENAEAYELYMKASEYYSRQTKDGFQLAVQLLIEAIKLDTGYAEAYRLQALALTNLYRVFDSNSSLLDEAEVLCNQVLRLRPDLFSVYLPLSMIHLFRGRTVEAEEAATEFTRKDPLNFYSHFALGFFYGISGQSAKAIAPFEESARLKPDNLSTLFNLPLSCGEDQREKREHWAKVALPYFERHLKLHPDDEHNLVRHAELLFMADKTQAARAAALRLRSLKDCTSLFDLAGVFAVLGDASESLEAYRKAMEAGYKNTRNLRSNLLDKPGDPVMLADEPGYEEVMRMVEQIEQEAKANG